jgi:hypothetical protein
MQLMRRAAFPGFRLLAALIMLGGVVALAMPVFAQSATPATTPDQAANAQWAVTLGSATLHSQPDDNSEQFSTLTAGSPLQILSYQDNWAYVYNPRGKGTAWLHSDLLGPSDPPSAYVYQTPPADEEAMGQTGRVVEATDLAVYPSPSPDAALTPIAVGTQVSIAASLHGEDGAVWYRTDDGNFLPSDAVSFAPPPAPAIVSPGAPPARVLSAGHWLDVDLSLPARVTAYDGAAVARVMAPVIGRQPRITPTGTFSIIRRVANETMDSSTIGIPRNGPGGYYLTGVLFTQYFTSDGASLHYNYWSSNWGYPGSHGCLGLSYADSSWLWTWSTIGTPLSIHY